jgi:hypothetical protein
MPNRSVRVRHKNLMSIIWPKWRKWWRLRLRGGCEPSPNCRSYCAESRTGRAPSPLRCNLNLKAQWNSGPVTCSDSCPRRCVVARQSPTPALGPKRCVPRRAWGSCLCRASGAARCYPSGRPAAWQRTARQDRHVARPQLALGRRHFDGFEHAARMIEARREPPRP